MNEQTTRGQNATQTSPPILHILVVGFHHKLGCQVEFSYPPLIPGTAGKNECPSGWKYLPTLALPDGSHNFTEDTVFFNLPSVLEPTESVFGVSCYRQIPVEKLKIRTADVTRSTVQKSVCILTRIPIYGYIEVKLSLIADAFFDQGDFACTDILVESYKQLNACLLEAEVRRQRHFYIGISLREIVLHWRHKLLMLFKLFLLQRRVICFGSPVRRMCVLILGVASLIPRLLEKGFQEVACVRTSRPLSPMPDFTDSLQREAEALQQEKQLQLSSGKMEYLDASRGDSINNDNEIKDHDNSIKDISIGGSASGDDGSTATLHDSVKAEQQKELRRKDSTESCSSAGAAELNKRFERSDSLTREGSVDTLISTLGNLSAVCPDEYRAPISIFASGNLCLPYLSLPYMDLLSDPSVLSYIIGTSNVLFQQKRQLLADVLVDIENANLDVLDAELRRQLVLSTEDLRFMDFIMKHVQMPKEDAEGSEQWIREQFQGYILALLRTAVVNDTSTKDIEHFNSNFMNAFKCTQCFQEWYDVRPDGDFFAALPAGHPFAGQLSVADMKLKIAQTMQNSESGRKINQAVNNTSRAVGGAISQAKGAFSNWWSAITAVPAQQTSSSGENTDGNYSTKSSSPPLQAQEVSVTFQNGSKENNIDMAVSINIEEPIITRTVEISTATASHRMKSTNISRNTSSASSAGGSEKLVDSAEELEEDSVNQIQKPPSDAEEASTEVFPIHKGIVEIGKEADILEKSSNTTTSTDIQLCSADTANLEEHNNDGIFIV